MAFLSRSRKIDLINLAKELDLEVQDNIKVSQLIKIISECDNYNEETCRNMLQNIEIERNEAIAKTKEDREFELQKLQAGAFRVNDISTAAVAPTYQFDAKKVIQPYEKGGDMGLYLNLCERQMARAGVPREDYVMHLLGLLPLEIITLLSREPEEVANNYEHIKKVLLHCFHLSPEQFRLNFTFQKKDPNATWRDFAFGLSSSLDGWISGLEVKTFEELKELLVVDQIRRKLPKETRDNLLDKLPKIKTVKDITEMLDDYDSIRASNINKTNGSKFTALVYNPRQGKSNNNSDRVVYENSNTNIRNEYAHKSKKYNKDENVTCFICKNIGHKSYACPNKDSKPINNVIPVNNASVNSVYINEAYSGNIIKNIEVLNKRIEAVVDTAASLNICNEKVYHILGSPKLEKDTTTLVGISNVMITPLGYFTCAIAIDTYKVHSQVYVMQGLESEFILGNPVLCKFNFNINEKGIEFTGIRNAKMISYLRIVPAKTEVRTNIPEISVEEVKNPLENLPCFQEDGPDVGMIQNDTIKEKLLDVVKNYKPNKVKDTNLSMNIVLTDEAPINVRSHRMSQMEQQIVEDQVQNWLKEGIIKESDSDFSCPLVLTRKRSNEYRICLDFRQLNKKIVKFCYPLPLIEDVVDKLQNAKVFTSLDLKNGFFHVKIDPKCTKYTAFNTATGHYEFLRVPFGLCISSSVFQRYVNTVFKDLLRDGTLMIYVDDLIIPSQTEEEGLEKLEKVLRVASEYGLQINFKKCQLLKHRIEFLGYLIENGTVKPSPSKTLALQNFPEPRTEKQVQSFLGLAGFFRKFVKDFATISKPLSDILRESVKFQFGPEQREAFNKLKQALSQNPVLHIFKQGQDLELHTDASSQGFGAVLMQKADDNTLHPIHYMSKKTNVQQEKYGSYELEALAVVEAVKKFRNYLIGTKFKIITDCAAFQKTLSKKDLTPKIARWALMLEEFEYEIVHRPGKKMQHVDALSRNAVLLVTRSQTELTTRIAAAQDEDEHIKLIKSLVQKEEDSEHVVKQGVLYKYQNDQELLVVPSSMQAEIVREVHNKGHFASAKTEEVLKQNYYIPNMKKIVETIVANCIDCILYNRKRGKAEGFLNPIPKESVPLSTYHIDYLGPLASTNKQYQHIFTVIDAFTKFTWLYPVKATSTKCALEKLELQQTTFGNPLRIISDRGSAFTSNDFEKFCVDQGIEHVTTTTGVHRGNGQVERVHNTLIPVLSKLSSDDPTKWYKFVPRLQRIINSANSSSTGFSPFELLTGVKMKNKEDLKIKELLDEEHINGMNKERNEMRDEAKKNILKMQEQNRKYFDRKRKEPYIFKTGDLVAIQRTQFGAGLKLRQKYFGPYKIVALHKNHRYDVEKVGQHEGPHKTITAIDFMKPWVKNK